MKSSWVPTDEELDQYAATHLAYEVRVLTAQMTLLEGNPSMDAQMDALIEAVLVHLRLLDDFFGRGDQMAPGPTGGFDDVFAGHWDSTYTPAGFLGSGERRDINAQVAHMSARRAAVLQWDLSDMTARACASVVAWVAGVGTHDSDREAALLPVDHAARRYLGNPPGPFIPANLS